MCKVLPINLNNVTWCLFSKYNYLCFIILCDLRQMWSGFNGIRTVNHAHAGQNWKCSALNDHKLSDSVVLNTLRCFWRAHRPLMVSNGRGVGLWWRVWSLHAAGRRLRAAADGRAQGFRRDQVQIFIIRDLIQVISVLQQLPAQVRMNLRTCLGM